MPALPFARPVSFLALAVLLAACSNAAEERRIAKLLPEASSFGELSVCSGSGCTNRHPVRLGDGDWSKIDALFVVPPPDPAEERRRIALAVGIMEILVGHQAGTRHDVGRNASARDQSQQLDCVDEAVNTTTYLRLFEERGLLRWHQVGLPANRLIDLVDAHNTAVVTDTTSGIAYAVDSWFYDNGTPAMVLPLATWRSGWDPADGDRRPPDPPAGAEPPQTASGERDGQRTRTATIR